MKAKYLVLSVFVIFLVFTRCEKDTNSDFKNDFPSVNLKLINEVQQISSPSDQRLAYNLLTPDEKAYLWKQKISTALISNILNEQQISHLKKLKSFINIVIFEKPNNDSSIIDSFAKSWCIEGLNYFTKEEIKGIAFNISNTELNDNKFKSGIITPNLVELKKCNCNSTSAFSCNSCWATNNCQQVGGCGFLCLYTCNGLCSAPVK